MTISNKAMLAKLSISEWKARKKDWSVTKSANSNFNATDKAGFYEKYIIAKDELKEINQLVGECRTFHYEQTLPYSDNGERILPVTNFMDYTNEMRSKRQKIEIAVSKFLLKYPALVTTANKELGDMWDPKDYPSLSEIKEKFSFNLEFKPITDPQDFRVTMDEKEKKKIQDELEAKLNANIEEAHRYLWDTLYKNVSHMAAQLSKTPTVDSTGKVKATFFKDAVVNNIAEICDLLPKLNITGDVELEKMATEVRAKLTEFGPQDLRDDPEKKKTAAEKAEALMKKMDMYRVKRGEQD